MKNNNELTTIEPEKITKFNVTLQRIETIAEKAIELKIEGVKDNKGLAKVKRTRRFVQNVIKEVDTKRKDMNHDALLLMRANNHVAKFIISKLIPAKLYLQSEEKAIKNKKEEIRLEKKRIKLEKLQKRIEALNKFDVAFDVTEVEKMKEKEFQELLSRAEISFVQRKVAREQEAKKHWDEVERLRKENELLKKETLSETSSGPISPLTKDQANQIIENINLVSTILESGPEINVKEEDSWEKKLFQILPNNIQVQGDYHERTIYLDEKFLDPINSLKIYSHSPDGFNWGYSGSGPAQLALAILMEYLPVNYALQYHQAFKFSFVGLLPGSNFKKELNLRSLMQEILFTLNKS